MVLAGVRVPEGCGSGSKHERGSREVVLRCGSQRGTKAQAYGVRTRCRTKGGLNLLWNNVVYMNISSIKYQNQ